MVKIGNDWDELLQDEFKKRYYVNLREFLKQEYSACTIYPHMNDIFNALKLTAYSEVKAVILGQDPYHEPGQAHGLCFSVQAGTRRPPSLENIFKELTDDTGIIPPSHGDLTSWAKNGVLLLNTALTVRQGMANSHRNRGWEIFTDRIIELLNNRAEPIVFILWGMNARAKTALLTNSIHMVLTSAHPSPLSAHNGFFGNRHFSKANIFLEENKREQINWRLEDEVIQNLKLEDYTACTPT
ncbi:MAG: uracil-DNA glycosylase [Oscillospiraceae bacterium]|jgi:uracil-DNA glycosylase|nr:uracil-DNA glycosylase [Oscillospiraceae bacterium]